MSVTGEQVKDAMVSSDISRVDHHDCGLCGVTVCYLREGDQLYFDPGCGCFSGYGPEPREWDDAADWINMQSKEETRKDLMEKFGITP